MRDSQVVTVMVFGSQSMLTTGMSHSTMARLPMGRCRSTGPFVRLREWIGPDQFVLMRHCGESSDGVPPRSRSNAAVAAGTAPRRPTGAAGQFASRRQVHLWERSWLQLAKRETPFPPHSCPPFPQPVHQWSRRVTHALPEWEHGANCPDRS